MAHRAVASVLDRRLSVHGASLWNWVLLREASAASGASQRELAERVGVEPPSLVPQLDRFVDEGYVERRRDEVDRRIVRVTVTPAGTARLAELHEVARAMDTELRSLMTERELAVMDKALTTIREHFAALDGPRAEGEETAGGPRR